jgi:hypothetical protein
MISSETRDSKRFKFKFKIEGTWGRSERDFAED